MKKVFLFSLFFIVFGNVSCKTQSLEEKIVGGPCEGCEAIHEYGNKILRAIDTLPGFNDNSNQPKMIVSGTVFKNDGTTPASNVIIYIYHANRQGIYELKGNEKGWAKRHGYNRGWVKTAKDGKYTFYTFRPGVYPDGTEPEHIHITIKEPEMVAYYLDEFFFEDDPTLKPEMINKMPKRGGSGVVKPYKLDGMLHVERDIILGKNIPDYN